MDLVPNKYVGPKSILEWETCMAGISVHNYESLHSPPFPILSLLELNFFLFSERPLGLYSKRRFQSSEWIFLSLIYLKHINFCLQYFVCVLKWLRNIDHLAKFRNISNGHAGWLSFRVTIPAWCLLMVVKFP